MSLNVIKNCIGWVLYHKGIPKWNKVINLDTPGEYLVEPLIPHGILVISKGNP